MKIMKNTSKNFKHLVARMEKIQGDDQQVQIRGGFMTLNNPKEYPSPEKGDNKNHNKKLFCSCECEVTKDIK